MIISKEEEAQETLPPYSTLDEPKPEGNSDSARSIIVTPLLVDPLNLAFKEGTMSSSSRPSQERPKHIKPAKNVRILRNKGSILGEYLIDVALSSDSEERFQPTVHLKSGEGNITAKIWLMGKAASTSTSMGSSSCALFILDCKNGFINLNINADCNLNSFTLKASCKNGGISISIPSSFVGPLALHTNNAWTRFYPRISRDLTTFTDMEGDKKCFIGDFLTSGYSDAPWNGSSMDVTCENGRVKLSYEQESDQRQSLTFLRQQAGYKQCPALRPGTFPYTMT